MYSPVSLNGGAFQKLYKEAINYFTPLIGLERYLDRSTCFPSLFRNARYSDRNRPRLQCRITGAGNLEVILSQTLFWILIQIRQVGMFEGLEAKVSNVKADSLRQGPFNCFYSFTEHFIFFLMVHNTLRNVFFLFSVLTF